MGRKGNWIGFIGTLAAMIFVAVGGVEPNSEAAAGTLTVKVTHFPNDHGMVYLILFNSKEGFPADYKKGFRSARKTIQNREATFVFRDIPFDTYAITLFHDENDNQQLDKKMFIFPTEGYGFSNNTKRLGPPVYEDACFELSARKMQIEIKIQQLWD